MFTFNELAETNEYKSLPDALKIKAKVSYYKDFVEPKAIEDGMPVDEVRTVFFNAVKFESEPNSVIGDMARTARDTALAVPKVAGTVLSSIPAMAGGAISAGVTAIPEWTGLLPKGTSRETFDAVSNFLTYKPFQEMMKQGGITEEGDKAWEGGVGAVSMPFEYLNNS